MNTPGAHAERPLFLIAGPCVIEHHDLTAEIALFLRDLTADLDIPFVFKASYDKANRTSLGSFRGPGLSGGLAVLRELKQHLGIRIIADVHRIEEVAPAAEVLDIIQIPAFLCRQTDLLLEVAAAGRPINIKKGQFLAPWDMVHVVEKIRSRSTHEITITERGVMFGYNNLVVDFRGIRIMHETTGCPVIFDATHSVQLPGGQGGSSGGQREFVPALACAAVAAGVEGVFLEVHPRPEQALCDGPNSLALSSLEPLLRKLKAIRTAIGATP